LRPRSFAPRSQEAFFSPTSAAISEGFSTNAVFKLSAPAPVGGLSVAFTFTGTATYTSDFAESSVPTGSSITGSGTSGSGVAFFAAGADTVTLPLSAVDDGVAEAGGETVAFAIGTGTGYTLRAGQTSFGLTISDPPVSTARAGDP
jgi:hypothetical protein